VVGIQVKFLVTGSNGQVGSAVVDLLVSGGYEDPALGSADVTSVDAMQTLITKARPDAVIHCAAFTNVDACESQTEEAMHVNCEGVRVVAEAADACGAFVVAISTDYVFDGTKETPYVETDPTKPINAYGRTKLAGEQALDASKHAVVRTSWVCGARGGNMARTILRLLREDAPLRFVNDQRGHPTIASDLARELVAIARERRAGISHVTNQGAVSWYEFARAVVGAAGGDPAKVEPITTDELQPPRPAARPKNSVLDTLRLRPDERLPDFRESLPRLVAELSD
jgi:dTDP-4-dehydrorhamnose reductase